MHEKYRQKMICRESVNVVGNETCAMLVSRVIDGKKWLKEKDGL